MPCSSSRKLGERFEIHLGSVIVVLEEIVESEPYKFWNALKPGRIQAMSDRCAPRFVVVRMVLAMPNTMHHEYFHALNPRTSKPKKNTRSADPRYPNWVNIRAPVECVGAPG